MVDPAVHGRGIGKQLLAWGINQADSASPPLPCVLEASRAGRPVYEKRGFEKVDDCLIYAKDANGKKIEGSDYYWPVMLRKAKETSSSSAISVLVSPVDEEDLSRCAEISLAAFANDRLMSLIRPERLKNTSLSHQERVAKSAAAQKKAHYNQESQAFLKAADAANGRVLGFAVWARPGYPVRPKEEKKDKEEAAQKDPENDEEFLGRLIELANGKREKLMGDRPHW